MATELARDPDALLDARAVADLLGVDLSWVRTATRERLIPCVPLGRYRRYRRSSIAAWLEQVEQPGRPAKLRSVTLETQKADSPSGLPRNQSTIYRRTA